MNKLIFSLLTLSSLAVAQTIDLSFFTKNGQSFTVQQGDEFTVEALVPGIPAFCPRWQIFVITHLTSLKAKLVPVDSDSTKQVWIFKANQKGKQQISFVRYDTNAFTGDPVLLAEKTIYIDVQ